MNSITNLLDLEDTDIEITDIQIQGQTKTLTLSTPPVSHFCPSCGFRMYSRGIKKRTINHPILQSLFICNKISPCIKRYHELQPCSIFRRG